MRYCSLAPVSAKARLTCNCHGGHRGVSVLNAGRVKAQTPLSPDGRSGRRAVDDTSLQQVRHRVVGHVDGGVGERLDQPPLVPRQAGTCRGGEREGKKQCDKQ